MAKAQPILRTGATREDLAWAAGLFDGEGCFSHNKIAPSATIMMSDEDVIRRFHSVIGLGSIRFQPRKPGQKSLWCWATAGYGSVQHVVALLWFNLGVRRRARASELLREYAKRPARNQRKLVCNHGHDLTDPANVYENRRKTDGRIQRSCRRCLTEASLRCRHKKKAKLQAALSL